MSDQAWVAIAALAFLMLVQFGVAIWWASAVNGQVAALKTTVLIYAKLNDAVIGIDGRVNTLESAALAHSKMNDDVIRLQEQIKHLTNLIEKWLQPPPRRRTSSGAD